VPSLFAKIVSRLKAYRSLSSSHFRIVANAENAQRKLTAPLWLRFRLVAAALSTEMKQRCSSAALVRSPYVRFAPTSNANGFFASELALAHFA
jgi:predicted transcriptional regulator of viral defense system